MIMNTMIPTRKQLKKELCDSFSQTFIIYSVYQDEGKERFFVSFPAIVPLSGVNVYVDCNDDGTFTLSDGGELKLDKTNISVLRMLAVCKARGVKESESEPSCLCLYSTRELLAWKIYSFANMLAALYCLRFATQNSTQNSTLL